MLAVKSAIEASQILCYATTAYFVDALVARWYLGHLKKVLGGLLVLPQQHFMRNSCARTRIICTLCNIARCEDCAC